MEVRGAGAYETMRRYKAGWHPCTLLALGSSDFCWAHDPNNAEARRKGRSRGGRSKPISDLGKLKEKLVTLGDDVMAGRAVRANAAVAVTCYGTAIKAIEALCKLRELEEARLVETRLKVVEPQELIGRLEQLEQQLQARRAYYGA